MADAIKNFAKVTVDGLYDASATEITLKTGDGAKLPNPSTDGEFNLVWWNADDYPDPADDPNVEIVRCTGRSTDTLTVTRNQEGSGASTKNTTGKTYKMILGVTKKSMDDKSEVGVASGRIAALAEKTTPVDDDLLIVEDSAATNAPKKVKMSNLPGGGMEDPMTTSGDMIYRGSTQPARLPKGTQGYCLTMGASYPEWQRTCGWELIKSGTFTTTTALSSLNGDSDHMWRLIISTYTDSALHSMQMRFNNDTADNYNYSYHVAGRRSGSDIHVASSVNGSYFNLSGNSSYTATRLYLDILIFPETLGNVYRRRGYSLTGSGMTDNSGQWENWAIAGGGTWKYTGDTTITRIDIIPSTTLTYGRYWLLRRPR